MRKVLLRGNTSLYTYYKIELKSQVARGARSCRVVCSSRLVCGEESVVGAGRGEGGLNGRRLVVAGHSYCPLMFFV